MNKKQHEEWLALCQKIQAMIDSEQVDTIKKACSIIGVSTRTLNRRANAVGFNFYIASHNIDWDEICPEALRLLEAKEVTTISEVAKVFKVHPIVLSNHAKKRGINLNLRGHGVAAKTTSNSRRNGQDGDSELWSQALFKKSA